MNGTNLKAYADAGGGMSDRQMLSLANYLDIEIDDARASQKVWRSVVARKTAESQPTEISRRFMSEATIKLQTLLALKKELDRILEEV